MNRITRCPACATVYRVSDEQLSAAGGWLRCGQCQHVFDSTGFVLNWPQSAGGAPSASDQTASNLASGAALTAWGDRIVIDDLPKHEDPCASARSSPASDELSSFEEALSTFRPQLDVLPQMSSTASQPDVQSPESLVATVDAPAARPVGSVWFWLLGVLLALQLAYVQRHVVAQYWPPFEAVLQNFCLKVSCDLQPLQYAEGVVIESSSLVRRSDDWVLRWTLRNTTNNTVGMTALELTLLDAPDKPVLRKVFLPSHMNAPALLTSDQIWAGELILRTNAEIAFSDYRILNFYP